jgi:hypothetical protein
MATKSELRERLNDIDAWLAAGAKTVTLDGVVVSVDHQQLRNERARIERLLGKANRKQAAYRVDLGG